MAKVAIQLLLWNGKSYLTDALASVRNQTFPDIELVVRDNGSTDGSVELIKTLLAQFGRPTQFESGTTNLGFAGGHNTLFNMHTAPYVLCLNQDAVLAPDYIEKLVAFMDAHPDVGSVSGKLLRLFHNSTKVIDTAGLALKRTREIIDVGAGATDNGQFDGTREVFGVSGAVPLYRRSAVVEVSPNGELFDGHYFAYKEDGDIAWRLRSNGWRSFVVGEAIAQHVRTIRTDGTKMKSIFLHRLSYRNHLMTLIKNEAVADFLRDLPWIIGYEFAKLGYLLLTRPAAVVGMGEVIRALPRLRVARRAIQQNRKVSIRKWIV